MRAFVLGLCLLGSLTAHAANEDTASFAAGRLNVRLMWIKGPLNDPGESTLKVQFVNTADNSAIAPPGPLEVEFLMNMPGMEHGIAPVRIQPLTDDHGRSEVGAYMISGIYFSMSGPWELHLHLHYADGRVETSILKLQVPD